MKLCPSWSFSELRFFFFKQKTAYEMRISDWSSDVCSSDLPGLHHGGGMKIRRHRRRGGHGLRQPEVERKLRAFGQGAEEDEDERRKIKIVGPDLVAGGQDPIEVVAADDVSDDQEIGRASCRERVCQYV